MPQPRQGGLGVEGLPLMDDHGGVLVGPLHFLPSGAPLSRPRHDRIRDTTRGFRASPTQDPNRAREPILPYTFSLSVLSIASISRSP